MNFLWVFFLHQFIPNDDIYFRYCLNLKKIAFSPRLCRLFRFRAHQTVQPMAAPHSKALHRFWSAPHAEEVAMHATFFCWLHDKTRKETLNVKGTPNTKRMNICIEIKEHPKFVFIHFPISKFASSISRRICLSGKPSLAIKIQETKTLKAFHSCV